MTPRTRSFATWIVVAAAALAAGCERPPVDTVQRGYRGLGMVELYNPRILSTQVANNELPEVVPAVPPGGPAVGTVYKNVQVLNDLSVGEFTRLMVAITNWVAPKEGCLYCHSGTDLASDELYTKVVARRMLQMTRNINSDWKSHVAETGVTCFTCHRGQPIPAYTWTTDPGPRGAGGMAASRQGQNVPGRAVGLASLPTDPFTPLVLKSGDIRVASTTALPTRTNTRDIKDTEVTYALMMHISGALGVNCTYCHNTRSFFAWDGSTPQRATAYYGIRLVRDLNVAYLDPLASLLPADRAGPAGDGPKVNCATCHQGAYKPLFGASMLPDYPSLAGKVKAAVALPGGASLSLEEGSFNLLVARYLGDSAGEPRKVFVFENLNFESGTTKLTPESEPTVATLVVILKSYPNAKASLDGYTDNVGDPAANQKLSLARANAVREMLIAGGIDAARLTAEGYGETKPIAPNDAEDGRAKNRRLELAIAR